MRIVLELGEDLTRADDLQLAAAHLALEASGSAPDTRRAIVAEVTRRWLGNGNGHAVAADPSAARMAPDPGTP